MMLLARTGNHQKAIIDGKVVIIGTYPEEHISAWRVHTGKCWVVPPAPIFPRILA